MTKHKWSVVTSITLVFYSVMLLLQAFWPGWADVQSGEWLGVVKVIGAVALMCWVAVFYKADR